MNSSTDIDFSSIGTVSSLDLILSVSFFSFDFFCYSSSSLGYLMTNIFELLVEGVECEIVCLSLSVS